MTTSNQKNMAKLENFLSTLIKLSVKQAIDKEGMFSLINEDYISNEEDGSSEYYVGETDTFSDDITKKCQLQIHTCYQDETYGSVHNIDFEVIGELANIFQKYQIDTKFSAWYTNDDGEPCQDIFDINEFTQGFSISTHKLLAHIPLENFDDLFEEITRPFLFELLRNKSN